MFQALKAVFRKLAAAERVEFYAFLLTLLENGEDVQRAIGSVGDILETQAAKLKLGGGQLKKSAQLYKDVEQELRRGRKLHEALIGRIPDSEVLMLMAGDTGNLKDALLAASAEAKAAAEMKAAFIKGLLYPGMLAFLVVVAMNWIGSNLLPTLTKLKPLEEWSPAEQNLYWATNNVGVWLPLVIITLIGVSALIAFINASVVGGPREKIHSVPPLNVIRKLTAASYLTTLSSLVKAGEPVHIALERMATSSRSAYMVYYIDQSLRNIRAGLASRGVGKALASNLFSPWVMVKLEIYSRGGTTGFANKMADLASDARGEAMSAIGGFSKLIAIIMLLVVAGVIGFTVITMYGITASLQGGM